MPTVLEIRGFRFFFYSEEGTEPPHIHAEKGDAEAKFWLEPVRLAKNWGFAPHDLKTVRALVLQNKSLLLKHYATHHAKKH